MKNLARIVTLLGCLFATGALAQGTGQLAPGKLWGNPTGSKAPAKAATVQEMLTASGGGLIITGQSASLFAVGIAGATNPAFNVNTSVGSSVTGVNIIAQIAGSGVYIRTTSSGSNESLSIDALGTGAIRLGDLSTGNIILSRAITYGGVALSNSVTGTTSMVLALSPAITTPNIVTGFAIGGAATTGQYARGNGSFFVSSAIQAADLPIVANASGAPSATFGAIKCDGTTITCSSGLATAVGGSATAITIGTTSIVSGTTGRLLYDNSAVIGELTIGAGLAISGGALLQTNSLGANKFQYFTSGTGTITTPTGAAWAKFVLVGAGGGGGGGGTAAGTSGTTGNPTCIKSSGAACTTPQYQAGGGGGGTWSPGNGGAGGTASGSIGCTTSVVGGTGGPDNTSAASTPVSGAPGGNSTRGGAGAAIYSNTATGTAGAVNSGSGGQGGGSTTSGAASAGSGGAGATCVIIIQSPGASYTYDVGTGGPGGAAGSNGAAGGAGGSGFIEVEFGFN